MSAAACPVDENANPEASRNPTLDGFRGVAIGLVLVCHYFVGIPTPEGAHGLSWLKRSLTFTFGGVELFFVLSGYLIGTILLRKKNSANLLPVFYIRRACRIFPAYALLLISFAFASSSTTLREVGAGYYVDQTIPLWGYLTFLQNNLMGTMRNIGPWWLVVTWSLAVEEQFYLAAPWLVKRLKLRLLVALAAVAVVACPCLRWVLFYQSGNPFGACYMTFTRIDSLIIGLALAGLCADQAFLNRIARFKLHLGAASAALAFAFFGVPIAFDLGESFIVIWAPTLLALSFAAQLLWLLACPESMVARMLGRPAWVFAGSVSYFVYLFHLPVLYTTHAFLDHNMAVHWHWREVPITLLALMLTFIAGSVSRRWLELPFISLGHRFNYSIR